MKKKNGFTLIELLAVIIILGILMIIAIPSVTAYIQNSRKSAYVDTAKEIIAGARNFVNEGKLELFDTDTTYYIDSACIKTESGQKSPYGEFTDAYVIVTYDGKGYNYYWVSRDETGTGVKDITLLSNLDEDDIVSDIKAGEITPTVGVGGRSQIQIIGSNCEKDGNPTPATSNVPEEGGSSSGDATPLDNKVCRRATTLHTATCTAADSTYRCSGAGYTTSGSKGTTTITYGNLVTGDTLSAGDAFDCDVNGDGTYDPTTERFYYVSDYYDVNLETPTFDDTKATLIYYTNVEGGTTASQTNYAYDSANTNYNGPRTSFDQLPTTTQWSNSQIIAPGTRQIRTERGATWIGVGPIESFTYENRAARLLTTQELVAGCSSLSSVGSYTTGELDGCNYLMENIGQYEGTSGTYGYWLESPFASYSGPGVWVVYGSTCQVYFNIARYTSAYGVRPVITVSKDDISY